MRFFVNNMSNRRDEFLRAISLSKKTVPLKIFLPGVMGQAINYQANFIHKEADDALEAVVDF